MSMNAQKDISPSRQYRVIMMTEDSEEVVEIVTLPATLVNNAATVEVWYQKHVQAGSVIVEVEPVETIPVEITERLETIPVDVVEEDDESEKDDDEPLVALWPAGATIEVTKDDVPEDDET